MDENPGRRRAKGYAGEQTFERTVVREHILHVDMDAFFASIEQRDVPSLRGVPVAVGGSRGRGVVAAASYEARQFGVRSAMPIATARMRCPSLRVVAPRGDVYRAVSRRVMTILGDVSPVVEPVSLDEAFLDVRGLRRQVADATVIGHAIRRRIRDELDLPCSVGIASTKSVAKVLSARAKPDGLLHWPTDEVSERLRPLPVEALSGIGPRTRQLLAAGGLHAIGDLVDADPLVLARMVGPKTARRLRLVATGVDGRPVGSGAGRRTLSTECTFQEDVADADVLRARLRRLADELGARLRTAGLGARTVDVKLRTADFVTRSRSSTLASSMDDTSTIVAVAQGLVDDAWDGRTPVRLIGIGVANVAPLNARQLALGTTADDAAERRRRLDAATDQLRAQLGPTVIQRAANLTTTTRRQDRSSDHGEQPLR